MNTWLRLAFSALAVGGMAACGGGSTEPAPAPAPAPTPAAPAAPAATPAPAGSTVELRSTEPAVHTGALTMETATIESRAADSFFGSPYCALTATGKRAGSSTEYEIKVYWSFGTGGKTLNVAVAARGSNPSYAVSNQAVANGFAIVSTSGTTRNVFFEAFVMSNPLDATIKGALAGRLNLPPAPAGAPNC